MRKRLVFFCISLLGLYVLSEIFSFSLYLISRKEIFSFSKYQQYRMALMYPDVAELPSAGGVFKHPVAPLAVGFKVSEVIHPYLGYVRDPTKMPRHSEYGFPGEFSLKTPKTSDRVIIGILGGSFAEGMTLSGKDSLIQILKSDPRFSDKEILVYTLAMGGYKQPQQLFTVLYFLMLGAQFDILINVDGFNEVVLPPVENLPKQVVPYYPRSWFARTYNFSDAETLKILGEISFITYKRQEWAQFFDTTPLRYNVTCNLIWRAYDMKLYHRLIDREVQLQQYTIAKDSNIGYMLTGPSFEYRNESELYADLARTWQNSSIQLNKLCQINGIAYFHFLQPNQYVANSKVLSPEERTIAYSAHDGSYKDEVEKGYPDLIRTGKILRDDYGIDFYDLTMIFKDNDAILYHDTCCHLNESGYKLVAEFIGNTILKK